MGYYTAFELTVSPIDSSSVISELTKERIEREIDLLNVFEHNHDYDVWYGYAKWYDWEKDMLLLSSKFPNILFQLNGHGDSVDDFWIAYFLYGASQFCPGEIVYPDFDKEKLTKKDIDLDGEYSYQN